MTTPEKMRENLKHYKRRVTEIRADPYCISVPERIDTLKLSPRRDY